MTVTTFKKNSPTTFKEVKSKNHPPKRSGHRIVCDEHGFLYSFGGYTNDPTGKSLDPLFREVWRFNPITRTWQFLRTNGDMPPQVVMCAVIYFEKQLFVYGGTGYPIGEKMSNRIFNLNLETFEWTELVPENKVNCPNIPIPMYGQAMVMDEQSNCLYCIGGVTEKGSNYHMNVHSFDLVSYKWTELSQNKIDTKFSREKLYHQLVLFQKGDRRKIYCFGGGQMKGLSYNPGSVAVFDLASKTWDPLLEVEGENVDYSHLAPRHRICSYGSVVACGHFAYLFRGCSQQLWRFNLKKHLWEKMQLVAKLPRLIFGGVALTSFNKLYIFGGINYFGDPNNKLFDMYVNVPPLQELAWQALVGHFFKTKRNFTEKKRLTILTKCEVNENLSNRLRKFCFPS